MTGWKHGTPSGAQMHYRMGEKPCEACRAAKNEYNRKKNHLRRLVHRCISIPEGVLVDLYLNATPEAQEHLEAVIDTSTLDRMVAAHDEKESA
ncbi:hypothetical protein QNM97_13880 [Gordonia sp. L191]|uniref:hypothetical protein n=1 Tax=Gordonia sp. L191 TaxID=2982699 RepID=UPI0024C0C951|nr:hypothetical protein [Gordonia sp. L191]WHU45141.1 hypothetical protein QNM97_13880 [Gordonia sp. L191]